jgi:hypothetical protein
MKVSFYVTLLAAAVGIAAFFLPLVEVHRSQSVIPYSAFQLAGEPRLGDLRRLAVMTLYAPTAVFVLVGIHGSMRRRLGLFGAIIVFCVGILGTVASAVVLGVAGDRGASGAYFLLASSVLGIVAGIIGITARFKVPPAGVAPGISA